MISFPVVLINSLSILSIAVIIALLWSKRSYTGTSHMIALSVFLLIWASGTFAESISTGFQQKIWWRNFTQIGVFFAPAASLLFVIAYTGFLSRYRSLIATFSYTFQSAAILLILTDQWHHFIRQSISVVQETLGEALVVKSTMLGSILISVNFTHMAVAVVLLILFTIKSSQSMRKQAASVLLGMGICVVFSLVKVSAGKFLGFAVPISSIFAVGELFILLGMIRYDLLIIAPIARNEVFQIVDDGIIIGSDQGKLVDANRAALELFGAQEEKAEQQLPNIANRILALSEPWHDAIVHKTDGKFSFSLPGQDEDDKYYNCVVYQVRSESGSVIGSISVIKDVTEQKRKNRLLRHRAEMDGLTGVFNRQTFIEKVGKALLDCTQKVGMLFIDVDYFKKVNDECGHACGDYALKSVCERLVANLSRGDLIGRMGGEEFAIYFSDRNEEQTHELAERLRADIEQASFDFEGHHVRITISVGVATGTCLSFDELYRQADENLYRAKQDGRNCVRA